MIAPTVSNERIPPDSAHHERVFNEMYFQVVWLDSGQVEFYLHAIGRAVDIGGRLPQWTAWPAITRVALLHNKAFLTFWYHPPLLASPGEGDFRLYRSGPGL